MKEAKDGEVQKLKRRIKKLETENKRLKSELNSYEQAFKKTSRFLRDNTEEITLEGLIEAAKKDKSLKKTQSEDVSEVCSVCLNVEFKEIKTRFGSIKTCAKCSHREIERD